MKKSNALLAAVLAIAAIAWTPSEGVAQLCDNGCIECWGNINWHQSTNQAPPCPVCHGVEETTGCEYTPLWCATCQQAQEDTDHMLVSAIARRLDGGDGSDVASLAASFGDRLVLVPQRRMVVVLGGCSGQSFVKLVKVTRDTMRILTSSGIEALDDYSARAAKVTQ